jgi:HTH-type transcriptional regulator/antitoxin HipB
MRMASVTDIGAIIRGRRIELGMSQEALARRAGVSRLWVNEIEAGKPGAETGLVLRVLDVLGVEVEAYAQKPAKREGDR